MLTVLTNAARREQRPAKRTDALRRRILDVARGLFFRHGVDAVTARKIAERAGCSPTAIYLYYNNIDDVLHQLRMEGHALLARHFKTADSARTTAARLEAMGRAYYRFGIENPGYYHLMFLEKKIPRREEIQQEMYTLMLLRDVVSKGIERGEIRRDFDLTVLTNALWAQIHGVTSLVVQGLLVETASGQHREVLDQILGGIARVIRK